MQESVQDINWPGSVSFNYLMLMGTVCGAWQMLKAAQVAEAKINLSDGQHLSANNPDFYHGKLATTRFYIDQILPRYLSYAAMIKTGSKAIMAMDDDLF